MRLTRRPSPGTRRDLARTRPDRPSLSGAPGTEPLRLATVYRPAEQVSGDFYDVFRAGDGRIAIVMGDVSGKGVPAALVMGVIHGAVRSSGWPESTSAHERESASSWRRPAPAVVATIRSATRAGGGSHDQRGNDTT